MKSVAGRHQESSDREVLAGLVGRVTFHNPENGFCVLRTRARGHRDLVTVVGYAAMVAPGEWITASGEWVNDRLQDVLNAIPAERDGMTTAELDGYVAALIVCPEMILPSEWLPGVWGGEREFADVDEAEATIA